MGERPGENVREEPCPSESVGCPGRRRECQTVPKGDGNQVGKVLRFWFRWKEYARAGKISFHLKSLGKFHVKLCRHL